MVRTFSLKSIIKHKSIVVLLVWSVSVLLVMMMGHSLLEIYHIVEVHPILYDVLIIEGLTEVGIRIDRGRETLIEGLTIA